MPGYERIDDLFDNPAILKQVAAINEALDSIMENLKRMIELGKQVGLGKGLSESQQALAEARAEIEKLRKEREELINQEKRLKNAALEAANRQREQAQLQRQNTQALLDEQRVQQANIRTERLSHQQSITAIYDQIRGRRQSRNSIDAEAGSLNQLRAFLRRATEQFDAMGAAERDSVRGRALLSYIQDINAQVLQLEMATGRNQRNVGNYTESVKKAFASVGDVLGGLGLTFGAAEIAKKIFDTTVEINGLYTALHAVSGSQEEFITNQTYLSQVSDRLGLSLTDTTKTFTSFYTAATKSGLAAKTARTIFTDVAEATSTLHLSQEDTNGVLLAFSQILGKGKVQAEELRGQIGERIPGAFKIAADSIGVTEQKLGDMLQKGQLIASDFLPKFAQGLKDAFGNDNRVETLQGAINRLSNAFTSMVSDNSSGLSTFFKFLIDGFTNVLKSVDNLTSGISYVIQKMVDPKLGGEFLNTKLIKETADAIAAVDANGKKLVGLDELLTKSSNIGKNMAILKNRIIGVNDEIKDLEKRGDTKGITSDARALSKLKDELTDLNNQLDLANRTKIAYNVEIQARLPGGEDLNARKAATELTQAQLDKLSKQREEEAKAKFEDVKFEIQTRLDADKAIFEDIKQTYFKRLQAAQDYKNQKDKLDKLEADSDRKQVEEQVGRGRASAIRIGTIDKKLKKDLQQNELEYIKIANKIDDDAAANSAKRAKAEYQTQVETINQTKNSRLAALQSYYDDELAVANDAHAKGKISDKEYQKYLADSKRYYEYEKVKIANDAAIQEVEAELVAAEKILDIQKGLGVDTIAQENELKKIREKLSDLRAKDVDTDVKYTIDAEKAKTDAEKAAAAEREALRKKEIEGVKKLASAAIESITSLFSSYYESQKAAVEQQMSDLDAATQAQVDAVNASTASEEDKARQTAIINAKAAVQKQALTNKEKQIELSQARFEKAKSIASIIQNTAVAVTKVIPNPILMALAAAAGAIELGTVLATPLPKYELGTDFHPGGAMMVNDGGKLEVIKTPDGQVGIAKGWNAIVEAPRGTQVFPSIPDYMAEHGHGLLKSLDLPTPKPQDGGGISKMDIAAIERAIAKDRVDIKIINTFGGLQASMKKGASYTQFVNREIHFGA